MQAPRCGTDLRSRTHHPSQGLNKETDMTRSYTSTRKLALKPAMAGVLAALLVFSGVESAFAQAAAPAGAAAPATPSNPADSQPAPRLFVDPPLPAGLVHGVATLQFRLENIRLLPVFGAAA